MYMAYHHYSTDCINQYSVGNVYIYIYNRLPEHYFFYLGWRLALEKKKKKYTIFCKQADGSHADWHCKYIGRPAVCV